LGGGLRDIVPAPRGIRAVGDGACRLLIEDGVPGTEADVGEATDPIGVIGFMWRPETIAGVGMVGRENGEWGGIAGSTFSR
jgi:hypothetical protein